MRFGERKKQQAEVVCTASRELLVGTTKGREEREAARERE
jgi:hypothetical protein